MLARLVAADRRGMQRRFISELHDAVLSIKLAEKHRQTSVGAGIAISDRFNHPISGKKRFPVICEPSGRANTRPMLNSAKRSEVPGNADLDCFVARAPRNDGLERLPTAPSTSLRPTPSPERAPDAKLHEPIPRPKTQLLHC